MKQLTDFKPDSLIDPDLSRDGKWMVMARGLINKDVVLITGFR